LNPSARGQETIPASGGAAAGSGGSVNYTIGQITWNMYSGTNGTILQGVQQPFEISVVTAIENTEVISLECSVYPNPTTGLIKLLVKEFDFKKLKYKLFDLNGVLIQDKKIESEVTEINLDDQPSSIFFLKIIYNNKEIKVFKIIKN
jgi:hypothetical protein